MSLDNEHNAMSLDNGTQGLSPTLSFPRHPKTTSDTIMSDAPTISFTHHHNTTSDTMSDNTIMAPQFKPKQHKRKAKPDVECLDIQDDFIGMTTKGFPHWAKNMDCKNHELILDGPTLTPYWLRDLQKRFRVQIWEGGWDDIRKAKALNKAEKQNEEAHRDPTGSKRKCAITAYWENKKRMVKKPDMNTGSGSCAAQFGMYAISKGLITAIDKPENIGDFITNSSLHEMALREEDTMGPKERAKLAADIAAFGGFDESDSDDDDYKKFGMLDNSDGEEMEEDGETYEYEYYEESEEEEDEDERPGDEDEGPGEVGAFLHCGDLPAATREQVEALYLPGPRDASGALIVAKPIPFRSAKRKLDEDYGDNTTKKPKGNPRLSDAEKRERFGEDYNPALAQKNKRRSKNK